MASPWRLVVGIVGSFAGLFGMIASTHAAGPPKGGEGGGSGGGGGSGAAPQVQMPKVKAKLLAERPVLVPGKTATIGLHFTIQPGWHIYSNAISDSGSPPAAEWTLPPGIKLGQTQWPAPKRHLLPGDILDHVYENEMMLLIPVHVPADAKPGSTLKFAAQLNWMVCKEMCLIEKQPVSIELPVDTNDSTQVVSDPKFAAARARLAKPVTLGKDTAGERAGITAAWSDATLKLQVKDAKALTFYPLDGSLPPVNIIADGAGKADTLNIRFDAGGSGSAKAAPVRGVLEIKRAGAAVPETGVEYYELSIPYSPAR